MQIATFTRINQEILQYIAIRSWLYVPFLDTHRCAAQQHRNCNETDLSFGMCIKCLTSSSVHGIEIYNITKPALLRRWYSLSNLITKFLLQNYKLNYIFFQRTHYQHPCYQKMRESLKYWWPQIRGDGTQLQIEC